MAKISSSWFRFENKIECVIHMNRFSNVYFLPSDWTSLCLLSISWAPLAPMPAFAQERHSPHQREAEEVDCRGLLRRHCQALGPALKKRKRTQRPDRTSARIGGLCPGDPGLCLGPGSGRRIPGDPGRILGVPGWSERSGRAGTMTSRSGSKKATGNRGRARIDGNLDRTDGWME